MKCTIPGSNVKVFGRAIHALAKIGDELYVEPLQHGLALRTVNSSRSAYACFSFAPTFFHHYDDGTPGGANAEEEATKCKVTMKSCLTVFRSISTLEKTVEKCKMTLDMESARLIFQLHCRHGIVKTHNLAFIECETLQAVFSTDLCPNTFTSQTRLLTDAVVNFQTGQEEVTLAITPQKLTLKNYIEDEPDPAKVMHTELCIDAEEFDNFQVGVDADITFCLKELRAILGFTEACTLPLSSHFEAAGKPIVFSLEDGGSYEGNFVLATLADLASSQASVSQQPQSQQPIKRAISQTSASRNVRPSNGGGDASNTARSSVAASTSKTVHREKRPRRSEDMESALNDLMNDEFDVTMAAAAQEQQVAMATRHQEPEGEMSPSPQIPMQDAGEGDDDLLPGTPPSKRFKSLFFGTQGSTSSLPSQPPEGVVLAGDSGSDSDT